MRVYALGDVHGQLDMLRATHELIARDRAECGDRDAPVVHVGDYVDRGPDSCGVIEHLVQGIDRSEPWVAILGNHDRIFREFLGSQDYRDPRLRAGLEWFHDSMGGAETMASYGVTHRAWKPSRALWRALVDAVPERHVEFLKTLPLAYETDELFFAHAGIRPGVPFDEQTEDDLVWIRGPFLSDERDHGKIVVHGHTPVAEAEHHGNRIDLDTGAGYGDPMTAAVFEGRDCFILTEAGRKPLLPPPGY